MLENHENKLPDATENQTEFNSEVQGNQEQIEDLPSQGLTEQNDEDQVAEEVNSEQIQDSSDQAVVEEEKQPKAEAISKTIDETNEAIEDVENQVAIKSEDVDDDVDLSAFELDEKAMIEEVVSALDRLIKEFPIQKIGKQVDDLKKTFNIKFGALLREAKKQHKAEGGEPSDFHYENPIQQQYNDVLFEYKTKKQEYQDKIIKEREANFDKKQAVIDEIKDLIENGNPDNIYNEFRKLQDKWRAIGPVPREHYRDLWQTYHFHVERFYDLLHLSNELRDLDFKHNLKEKTKLLLKAEVLTELDNVNLAFNELQILHRMWKEEIGPVAREYREEVWNRFSAATKKIHDKRHNYFDALKETYEQNLLKKEAILEELKTFNDKEYKSHADWQKSIKSVETLRQRFIKAGRVPKHKDREIWEQFRNVNKIFNQTKNQYYKEIKKEQQANLEQKMKLIEIAESYSESDDWNNSTEVMKKIQQEWKSIGHVPRRVSDKIWNRFKEACNLYFDRYREAQNALEKSQMSVYIQKKNYLQDLKTKSEQEDFNPSIEDLMVLVNEWKDFGPVPQKQRYIDAKFNKFLDPYFDKVSEDKSKLLMLRYKTHIDSLVEQQDVRGINDEVQFVRKKIDQISREKQQMETNLQFFSNADDSNPMMKNINKEIDKLSFELDVWESKLQYLRSIEV